MPEFHSSAADVLTRLRTEYPESSFLALGQTVWWDEPMKAVLRRMLDDLGLGGRMVLGVHDTDYFAKVSQRREGQKRFELLPHNDGSTRDLWSAAGEVSRLFGSETVIRRDDFVEHGTPFGRIVTSQGENAPEFVDDVSEAWGWRGLVYTGGRDLIVSTIPLTDVLPAVERMLSYGFEGTRDSIVDSCCQAEAERVAGRLLGWVREYASCHPEATLSTLYQDALPRLYSELLGSAPQNVAVDGTSSLLRLSPETAGLPRFKFVDLFLNPATGHLARTAYDEALAGTEMYTLDRFGLGATPFDVILPSHGRGTLRVTLRAIHIETKQPIRIPTPRPVSSIHDLAEVLTAHFDEPVTLVGKAVALISMLSQEFIFVFNEEGSGYVGRTRQMNDRLRAAGIDLDMRPILRLKYPTWDALEAAPITLALPDHLANAFGQRTIAAEDFSRGWRNAVDNSRALLSELHEIKKPVELLAFLEDKSGDDWEARLSEYLAAKQQQVALYSECKQIQVQVRENYGKLRGIKQSLQATQDAMGDHFRATTEWTPQEERKRAEYAETLATLLAQSHETRAEIDDLKATRLGIERGEAMTRARETASTIEIAAEVKRMDMIRDALLTSEGLPHTHHRPSAWWLPMVDRTGGWFDRIATSTEIYLQPL